MKISTLPFYLDQRTKIRYITKNENQGYYLKATTALSLILLLLSVKSVLQKSRRLRVKSIKTGTPFLVPLMYVSSYIILYNLKTGCFREENVTMSCLLNLLSIYILTIFFFLVALQCFVCFPLIGDVFPTRF